MAAQGKNTYATGGNIEYISLATFNRKQPNPNTYVIYDEIDQIMGSNSFFTTKGVNDVHKCSYRPSVMAEWGCVMGFSGTVTESTQTQFQAEFSNALTLTIPSLRLGGSSNKITEVIT